MAGDGVQLTLELVSEEALVGIRPSMVAAALLAVGRAACGVVPFWPVSLQSLTGYLQTPGSELTEAIHRVHNALTVSKYRDGTFVAAVPESRP